MKRYILCEDEVILFRGSSALWGEWKELENASLYNRDLLLTNKNLVVMGESCAPDEDAEPMVLSIDEIKVYDDKIQVIRKKNAIEIYHKSGETYLKLENEKNAKELCDKILKVHSGYTKFVRSVKTAEKIIKDNTEPLGIDAKQVAKDTAKMAWAAITARAEKGKIGIVETVKAAVSALPSGSNKSDEVLLLPEEENT